MSTDDKFLAFWGQNNMKPLDVGRWRDFGEVYIQYSTKRTVVDPRYDSMFLGFEGQPIAKPFEVGRWRDFGEVYREFDTKRFVANVIDNKYGTRRIVLDPQPEPDPYIDHVERMRNHLISEFQWDVIDGEIHDDKPVLRAILTGIGQELDELDKAILALNRDRFLDTAEGKQLDGIGEIVGQTREAKEALALEFFGFLGQPSVKGFGDARFRDADEIALATYYLSDPEYRIALAQKIMVNIAGGTAEDTIASLKYIFNAPVVFLEETGNANIAVAIGKVLTTNEILLANAIGVVIRAGGVGLKYKTFFSYNHYFGFLGQENAKGFNVGSFADTF